MEFNKKVIWSPSAKEDVENISSYLIFNWNTTVLLRFLLKLDRIINQIVINPKQFPLINSKLQIRKAVITTQNTLFYRIKNQNIEIVRIYDTRQDPIKLKIIF